MGSLFIKIQLKESETERLRENISYQWERHHLTGFMLAILWEL